MQARRMVPFITFSELRPRAWVTLSGCNFSCRGCFSIARRECGEPLTSGRLLDLLLASASRLHPGSPLGEVIITGGEPTLEPEFLRDLVSGLSPMVGKVALQTNASLLRPPLLDSLIDSGLSELICDIKAHDDSLHTWYTGRSNRGLLDNIRYACGRIKTAINTLHMPGLVEVQEVERVARFLADCSPVDLEYRICPFEARLSPVFVCRDPTAKELMEARDAAAKILRGTVGSRSCLSHADEPACRSWITVFPDGEIRRRGMDVYRAENRGRFGD